MTRRMRDPEFRAGQLRELYAAHVKPVNKLVDELRVDRDRWLPHVAPMHGGTSARLLWIGSDPGLRPTAPYEGLLGVEADDAGSARVGALLKRAGIDPAETTPWNASPWYAPAPWRMPPGHTSPGALAPGAVSSGASAAGSTSSRGSAPAVTSPSATARPDPRAGVEPLRRLLELLDELEVVVLLGRVAERTWRTLASTHPDQVPYAEVLVTTEADDEGFDGTNAERRLRREQQALVFEQAGRLLREQD